MIHADFVDDHQFLVIYVSPSRPDVPPPPGLARWPQPGEVFLSPELLNGSDPAAVERRFGRFAGLITAEGLANPTERLAYHRPVTDTPFIERDGQVAIAGFGVDPDQIGDEFFPLTLADFGKWNVVDVYILVAFVVVLPAVLLLLLAVRSNAERRDRRLAMLDALGAPASARAWVLVGEAALPVVVGASVASLIALASAFMDVRVPITGYVVSSGDVSVVRPLLLPLAAGVVATAIGLVLLTQLRGRAKGETRPRRIRARFRGWLQAAFPLSVALATWGALTARGDASRYSVGLFAFLIGAVAVLASLPLVFGTAAGAAGGLIARLGAAASWPGAVVGGRWLRQRPALVARLCAAFVVGLGLLVQVQVQQTWIIHQTRGLADATTPAAVQIGDALLVVRTAADRAGADAFANRVGPDRVLRVIELDGDHVLAGTCGALRGFGELKQECTGGLLPIRSAYERLNTRGNIVQQGTMLSDPAFMVTTDLRPGGKIVGFFVLNDGGAAGAEQVSSAAYAHLSKPYVSTPGQLWISGGLAGAAVFDWVLSLGSVGLVILALAGALATAGMFLSHVGSLGVLGTYSARPRLYLAIATWNLGVPLVAAGIVGSLTAAFLGFLTLQIRRIGSISFEVLGVGLTTVAALAVVLTVLCGIVAARSVREWRPVAD